MKVAIIGAGITGIASAYELAHDGHEVTVFERNSMAAEDASFANAGLIAPSLLQPLSMPVWPAASRTRTLRQLSRLEAQGLQPLRNLKWLWKWNHSASQDSFLANMASAQALIRYSQARLRHIAGNCNLEYERSEGQLALVQSDAELKALAPLLQQLRDNGVSAKELTAEEARKLEPALSSDASVHGAIHFPQDEVGNCRQLGLLLKGEALRMGAQFQFNTEITHLEAHPRPALHTHAGATPQIFDAALICTGQFSYKLLATVGIKLPLTVAHGYTVSAPIREPLNAPRSAVFDIQRRISITRLGNRVRISGGAEFGGNPADKHEKTVQGLYRALQQYFPGAARYPAGAQVWKGATTLLPDGLPAIGASPLPGIWLNLGHGANGWGMACGSARMIADLIQHRSPDVDAAGFQAARRMA